MGCSESIGSDEFCCQVLTLFLIRIVAVFLLIVVSGVLEDRDEVLLFLVDLDLLL
jgi:hypothetical protein